MTSTATLQRSHHYSPTAISGPVEVIEATVPVRAKQFTLSSAIPLALAFAVLVVALLQVRSPQLEGVSPALVVARLTLAAVTVMALVRCASTENQRGR